MKSAAHSTHDVERIQESLDTFSKAFGRVDHPILLAKLHNLDIPPQAINWIISYLTGRTQILKYDGHLSAVADINTSIVQGLGLCQIPGQYWYLCQLWQT